MKKIRKHYELHNDTNTKIQQLLNYKKTENERVEIYSKVSEKMIIEEAISLYHSSKFGKDVFDETMTKLELVLGNMMKNVLHEFVSSFTEPLEKIYMQNIEIKEMLLFILKANNILPNHQHEIAKLLMKNEELEKLIQDAIDIKEQMRN